MSLIVEAVVSTVVDALFKKLASTDLLQFARQQNVDDDLKKWKTILVKIQAVLVDAEEKRTTNRLVEIWLGELKHLAYDLEDVLDGFATEALRRKLLDEPQASTSKVRKLIPSCFSGLDPQSIKLNSTVASQVKEMSARLQDIVEQKSNFDLKENSGVRSNPARCQRPHTTSLSEPHIYGREKDKEAILELLLKNEATDDARFSVISIEGMGGIGKTTLAQLVYNDVRVKDHFDITVWVCVSNDFNGTQVTKTILQSIAPETGEVNDPNRLQVKLKEELHEKRFFIVLDDVWNESYENWTKLCLPFGGCSTGSKIIVTTRNHSVSLKVGALVAFPLQKLSDDHCLLVFTRHSLGKEDFSKHKYLEEIGKKLIEKCDGLPLAAKTLGGLLRGKVSYDDWEDVLDSNMWSLLDEKNDIISALKVSYCYLPSHLKRCFAYCSIFPKDYEFQKKELVLLWMAEGFLQTERSKKQREDLGHEYFEDLHSRSFFQYSHDDVSRFVMHDLINDLSHWAAQDICSRIDNMPVSERKREIPKHLRHLSYLNIGSNYGCIQKFEAINEMKSLRTFLTLSTNSWLLTTYCDFPSMLLQLRCLRVLSLNGYPISMIPDSIGDLKLLHHLDLSHSAIVFLPDSINMLYNLEALILKHCSRLERLCSDIGNLIKLRHLYISRPVPLPSRIGHLTSLRTLQHFVVGKDLRYGLRELKDLMNLREWLHISGLENVNDLRDAEKADLSGKEGLKDLQLEWTRINDDSNEKEIAAQVLEKLRPCQKLESLHIWGYGGIQFPTWLGDTSLSSLVSLTFNNCRNCDFLPSVGQLPLLKILVICNMAEIKSLGPEFYGQGYSRPPFQSLEEFKIVKLQEWRDWIPCGSGRNVEAFPRLQQLSIWGCSKLQEKLPENLPSLKSLTIQNCQQLTVSVPVVPKHCSIQISKCKEVVLRSIKNHSSLSAMVHFFSGVSSHMYLAEGFTKEFSKAEKLELVEYDEPKPSLKIVCNAKALNYTYFDYFIIKEEEEELEQQELPCRVQYLALNDCKCPMKLEALQSLSLLRGLSITDSPKIIYFPEASLPSQLRFIVIDECAKLQSLPLAWMHSSNTSLRKMYIRSCDSLKCIARVHLPPNLKQLEIMHCSNLLNVLDDEEVSDNSRNTSCLEILKIEYCPSLTSLWSKRNKLPDTPQEIKLPSCSNPSNSPSTGNLPKALRYLSITGCSKLESLAISFYNNSKLENLHVEDCEKLQTLPSGMNNLISLTNLRIDSCPAMVSIPEGGFPTSVTYLAIIDTRICKSLFEWGLHRFMSLRVLKILAGDLGIMSFPQETGMILPTSLTKLKIGNFPSLERLSPIVQNLNFLEKLCLCNCPKLKFFPENGLPKSLKQLKIQDCPLLEVMCKEGEGIYWPMIAHLSYDSRYYTSS